MAQIRKQLLSAPEVHARYHGTVSAFYQGSYAHSGAANQIPLLTVFILPICCFSVTLRLTNGFFHFRFCKLTEEHIQDKSQWNTASIRPYLSTTELKFVSHAMHKSDRFRLAFHLITKAQEI